MRYEENNPFKSDMDDNDGEIRNGIELNDAKEKAGVVSENEHLYRMIHSGDKKLAANAHERLKGELLSEDGEKDLIKEYLFCKENDIRMEEISDKKALLKAIKEGGWMLFTDASYELKNDKEVALEAVKGHGGNLSEVGSKLKNDKQLVLEAVMAQGTALQYASPELRNDRDVVLAAVEHSGYALSFAGEDLRGDKDIVLVAVKNHPAALEDASDSLKDDKEIVMEALKHTGEALYYASERLKDDEEVVLEAMKTYPALDFASERLQKKLGDENKLAEVRSKLKDVDKNEGVAVFDIEQYKEAIKAGDDVQAEAGLRDCLKSFGVEDDKIADELIEEAKKYQGKIADVNLVDDGLEVMFSKGKRIKRSKAMLVKRFESDIDNPGAGIVGKKQVFYRIDKKPAKNVSHLGGGSKKPSTEQYDKDSGMWG